jgi:hypothetical protein
MSHWWEDKESAHKKLVPLVGNIREHQNYRHVENLRHLRLYGNFEILGLNSYQYNQPSATRGLDHRVTLNIVQSCVDTAASKIAKNTPRPMFLTSGGSPKQQKKAKMLQKFIDGAFYETRINQTTPLTFLDAGVFGLGGVKVYSRFAKICAERVNVDEILVDDAEGFYGTPRNLYQTKAVSREILLKAYPKHKAAINALPRVDGATTYPAMDFADLVQVNEAWHLPTRDDAKDGRHVICIEGADLENEVWERSGFPFAWYRWNPKLFGFYAQGLAEQLLGLQVEINKILRIIQVAQHLLSTPAVYVEKGSEVLTSHLNNMIGRIIKYRGTLPQVISHGAINPELYQHLERLYAKAFEIAGISQLSAQSKKPEGLDSGKALREFNDIESERFMQAGKRWEQYHVEISRLFIQEAREIAKKEPEFAVRAKNKRFIEKIKWAEVDVPEDEYIIQTFPTSGLSQTPSGRLKEVQEWLQSGMVDVDTGRELLDFPDLEAHESVKSASRKLVREVVSKILEDDEYTSPDQFWDLAYCVSYGTMSYNRAMLDGADNDSLELLTRFIETANSLLQASQPAPAPAPGGMPELGQPQAPPVSDLMPLDAA